jgi:hypothetical protein
MWFQNVLKKQGENSKIIENLGLNSTVKEKILKEGIDHQVKVYDIPCIKSQKQSHILIGCANLKVSEEETKPWKERNLSLKRQNQLFGLINDAIRNKKCDLLIFPELSIPFSWLESIKEFSVRNQVGFVFGMEYIVVKDEVSNFVVTILPFINENRIKDCFISFRIKNHYAPGEENELNIRKLRASLNTPNYYELFKWRGATFSVFNCFELTNIAHRGLMQGELDYLVAIALNHDTKYYDHILSSTARDLHCYVVYANTSDYGDSRITSPKKSEEMDSVRVKGGIEAVLLKDYIDIGDLRDFQSKRYDKLDNRYKPLPAGYENRKE